MPLYSSLIQIVIVQQQRVMLSWSNPRLVLTMDMLRQSHAHISAASEQLNIGLSRAINPNGPSNPNLPPNTMPPRPPQGFPQQQPESSSSPQVAPAPSFPGNTWNAEGNRRG
jgi:hypothetical protein